eukprot:TRINITY_DN2304_c0_g3_i2.p1 TRINITY_DN2304_c0_g3~~TRINITY_DN2304_c0_g3_i2.p1  ORF type:complete len:161 (+),score=21.82 TRINITY_DN2304_c0_g3_i2:68-550(+)
MQTNMSTPEPAHSVASNNGLDHPSSSATAAPPGTVGTEDNMLYSSHTRVSPTAPHLSNPNSPLSVVSITNGNAVPGQIGSQTSPASAVTSNSTTNMNNTPHTHNTSGDSLKKRKLTNTESIPGLSSTEEKKTEVPARGKPSFTLKLGQKKPDTDSKTHKE